MQPDELDELKQLVSELKSDRAAQKQKEAREGWTKYVSLSMVFIAVLAGLATLKGGSFTTRTLKEMNEATYNQAQASDQWAFYQAKSIKQNLYEIELDRANAAAAPEAGQVEKLKAKVAKYERERAEITAGAKKFEATRDIARQTGASAAEHSKEMGTAITLFQVAIALGGVCLIVKRKPLWIVSGILGALATAEMIHVLYFMPL